MSLLTRVFGICAALVLLADCARTVETGADGGADGPPADLPPLVACKKAPPHPGVVCGDVTCGASSPVCCALSLDFNQLPLLSSGTCVATEGECAPVPGEQTTYIRRCDDFTDCAGDEVCCEDHYGSSCAPHCDLQVNLASNYQVCREDCECQHGSTSCLPQGLCCFPAGSYCGDNGDWCGVSCCSHAYALNNAHDPGHVCK
jgi:hypothetical protein